MAETKQTRRLRVNKWYLVFVVAVLMLISTIKVADRELLAPLYDPVSHELGLNDLQFGTIRAATFAPIFVVSAVRARANLLRSMHRSGATAVFEWPRKERAFLGVMARIVSGPARQQRRATDRTLAKEAQLRLDACSVSIGAELQAAVVRRVAILGGQVDAAWKADAARRAVATVPGVQDVVTDGIALALPAK